MQSHVTLYNFVMFRFSKRYLKECEGKEKEEVECKPNAFKIQGLKDSSYRVTVGIVAK